MFEKIIIIVTVVQGIMALISIALAIDVYKISKKSGNRN